MEDFKRCGRHVGMMSLPGGPERQRQAARFGAPRPGAGAPGRRQGYRVKWEKQRIRVYAYFLLNRSDFSAVHSCFAAWILG
jgi:hypothetical protein